MLEAENVPAAVPPCSVTPSDRMSSSSPIAEPSTAPGGCGVAYLARNRQFEPISLQRESANLGSSAAHGASWGCAYSAFCVFDWMPLSMSALGGMSAPYS